MCIGIIVDGLFCGLIFLLLFLKGTLKSEKHYQPGLLLTSKALRLTKIYSSDFEVGPTRGPQ